MKGKILLVAAVVLALAAPAFGAVCADHTKLASFGSLSSPSWMAVDASGRLYVTETKGNAVSVFGSSGAFVRRVDISEPLTIAVGNGKTFVADRDGNLTVFDSSFNVIASAATKIKNPSGMTYDAGKIYISDSYEKAIRTYSESGAYLGKITSANAQFLPLALTASASTGDVYAASISPASVFKFNSAGTQAGYFTSDTHDATGVLRDPRGMALDSTGNLIISDVASRNIFVMTPAGSQVCTTSTLSQVGRPVGMVRGGNNILYIVDKDAGIIHRIGLPGFVMMTVSPLSLEFGGLPCGSSPSGKTVTISNDGTGLMNWTASSDAAWLSVSQASGAINGAGSVNVTVNVNPSGMAVGTYTGIITISSQGASEQVAVTLNVANPPALTAAPGSLSFDISGITGTRTKTLTIEIADDPSGSAAWSAVADAAWIKVSPSSGPSNTLSMASVSPDLNSLDTGTYTGNITVSSSCATGGPFVIPVTLRYVKGGTVNVTTNIDDASFEITGPSATYTGTGKAAVFSGLPVGTYNIKYGKVSGYRSPSDQSAYLGLGQAVNFTGNYIAYESKEIITSVITPLGTTPDTVGMFSGAGAKLGTFVNLPGTPASAGYPTVTASGDFDGDGNAEIITASGQGGAITGHRADGAAVAGLGFTAFRGAGADVASGDLDGDGIDEIIAGAGSVSGNPAEVRVFGFAGGTLADTGIDFYAYRERTGVNIASGDVDGDGKDEIVTIQGRPEGGAIDVRIWKAVRSAGAWFVDPKGGFNAGYSYLGVDVAVADLNGDEVDEIIVSSTPQPTGGRAKIAAFGANGRIAAEIAVEARGGVSIAAGDTDSDGVAEIAVADEGMPRVRVFDAGGTQLGVFTPYAGEEGVTGVRVSLGDIGY